MKNKYRPAIRFLGFNGDWQLRRLEDLLEERNEQMPENEKYQLMSFTATDGVTPKSDRYNREFLVKSDNKKYKKTEKGDLIYSSNNLEVGSIGLNNTGNAVISPVYSIFYVKDGITSDFMGMMIQRKEFINKMLRYRQGVVYGQWRIHESDFLNIETLIPSNEEQLKIGKFFKQITDTIALYQKELTILRQTKQGFLQKMFPKEGETVPEIRFPGFIGDWEERKLKETANYYRGSFPQPYGNKEWYDEENGKPFVQVADIGFDLRLNNDTNLKISKLAEPKSRYVEAGKVIVALQGSIEKSIGRVAITQYPSYIDRTILIFDNYKLPMDKQFFAYSIQKIFKREKESAPGVTISTITKESVSEFLILLPPLEEQRKIGNFFKQLDETIALYQRELEVLKETKKAFLQKMFA